MSKRVVLIGIVIVIAFLLGAGLGYLFNPGTNSGSPIVEEETVSTEDDKDKESAALVEEQKKPAVTAAQTTTPAVVKKVTIAWQPSHQNDTGDSLWHEYVICGDIVDRTMAKATLVNNVKCWDTTHGLTGTNNYRPAPSNTIAFDIEVNAANAAGADYFIAIHNDGGAPSGILGECIPGDALSRQFLQQFMTALCVSTGLPSRGITEVKLYSLEAARCQAPVRILLEIGDNVSNREQLESPEFRQLVANTLAEVANTLPDQR